MSVSVGTSQGKAPSKIKSCLNVLRRTPPSDTDQNLKGLVALLSPNEDLAEELLQRVDAPLIGTTDPEADNRKFLKCDHNRDGKSYRSPWSNSYFPSLEDGLKPSFRLRELEMQANEVFSTYCGLYFGKNATSSVYFWDLNDRSGSLGSSFAGTFLIQKQIEKDGSDQYLKDGFWNSVHVVEVSDVRNNNATYSMTTSIFISMVPVDSVSVGDTHLGGTITKQSKSTFPVNSDTSHIVNIGKFIEEIETDLRSKMDYLHIQKSMEAVEALSAPAPRSSGAMGQQHALALNEAILARKG
mmetsp:Transcript_22245/g.27196  ORF Transcript_22245/g.27196 Transcript_22245/m.27196 type:complete len:298 (-) Transcript_22245:169-1062(-)